MLALLDKQLQRAKLKQQRAAASQQQAQPTKSVLHVCNTLFIYIYIYIYIYLYMYISEMHVKPYLCLGALYILQHFNGNDFYTCFTGFSLYTHKYNALCMCASSTHFVARGHVN